MGKKILVIAEHGISETLPMTLELVACAREINNNLPAKITAVILGKDSRARADLLTEKTGIDSMALIDDNLKEYSAEGYCHAVSELAERIRPDLIIIPHSPRGDDYAPQLAVKLKAACICGVSGLEFEGDSIFYRRQGFYGKLEVTMESQSPCTVITILPGAFKYEAKEDATKGIVTECQTEIKLKSTMSVSIMINADQQTNLTDADTIIAAGKGMENRENIKLLQDLAALFPKSAVGGSRAACDQGWILRSSQIGLTGKTVSAKLYIACGISGALQHIAGMRESLTIVAINRDPRAAIFQHADFGVIEDICPYITAFISELQNERGE